MRRGGEDLRKGDQLTVEENGIPGDDDSADKVGISRRSVAETCARSAQRCEDDPRDAPSRHNDNDRRVPGDAGLHPHSRVAGNATGRTDPRRDRERRRRRIR